MDVIETSHQRWITSDSELAEFRQKELTVEGLLRVLASVASALLLSLDTGVGKTKLIDDLVSLFVAGQPPGPYDALVYITSRRDILDERRWVRRKSRRLAVLTGRPSNRCGALDAAWQQYERAGCQSAGRRTLCGQCPKRPTCKWPTQYTTEALKGKSVIAGLAAHLDALPAFIRMVAERVGASRPLVVLDEAAVLDVKLSGELSSAAIQTSLRVFEDVASRDQQAAEVLEPWVRVHRQLLDPSAPLEHIRAPRPLPIELAEMVQEHGLAAFRRTFRFLGYELPQILMCRRIRDRETGAIRYVRRPLIRGVDFIIAAAGVSLELARHRLSDNSIQEFCPGTRVLHEGTRLYNLRSSLGTATHFRRNAPQILWAAAQLAAGFLREGKRVLFVSKKCFAEEAAQQLERYLLDLLGEGFRVLVNPPKRRVKDPCTVPLLTYGVQGLNLFEGFEAAIAVNTYNTRADALDDRVNEMHLGGERVGIEIDHQGGQRRAVAVGLVEQRQGFSELAGAYLQHMEGAVAEQALGRVRFAVRPRFVLAMQQSPLRYPAHEFRSLAELRAHFGLETRREWEARVRRAQVDELLRSGVKPADAAKALKITARTLRRYTGTRGHEP